MESNWLPEITSAQGSLNSEAKQRERKRSDITVNAVFDIETESWTKFVCGGFLTEDGVYKYADWRSEEAFARFILDYEGTVWAHNGGGFDYKWLLDWLIRLFPERKAIITAAGSSMVACRIGKLRLFDSFALVKISLAEFSKATGGIEKIETGLECNCGGYCGGYCRIKRGMPQGDWTKVQDYLRRDCESLLLSLQALQKFAAANDLDIGATVGGSAWRNARRTLQLKDADDCVTNHMFAREAYFGGRVQKLRPRSAHGWEYDVSSMYPSRLANFGVPVGASEQDFGLDAKRLFAERRPGIYKAVVEVPRMHLCPLPVRTKDRVMYPYGCFVGTWALPELELAEELGVKITVRESLTWQRKEILFKPWIDKLFHIRANAPGGKKGPLGTFTKFYMNSLTGKFGSRPIIERIIVNPPDEDKHVCNCKHDCKGACGCYKPLDDAGFIVSQKAFRIEPCAHVEWAAYLTSEARVEWLKQALSNGDSGFSCVYGDTDSIFTEREFSRNLGSDLGQWECKGEYTDFYCIAPKVYHFKRKEEFKLLAKGLAVPRLKGAPDEVKQSALKQAARTIEQGRALPASGVVGFRSGANDGAFFQATSQARKITGGNGDRIYNPRLEWTEPREFNSSDEDEDEDDC